MVIKGGMIMEFIELIDSNFSYYIIIPCMIALVQNLKEVVQSRNNDLRDSSWIAKMKSSSVNFVLSKCCIYSFINSLVIVICILLVKKQVVNIF